MKGLSINELIELARECAGDKGCVECYFNNEDRCVESLLVELADKLEELDTRWVDCKLALPKEEDEYLVMIAGAKKPTVLRYDHEEEMFYEEDCDFEPVYYPVTHWAELPEGPAAGASPRPTDKVKRCATCRHEDKLGDEERCIECEKHHLWEEKK